MYGVGAAKCTSVPAEEPAAAGAGGQWGRLPPGGALHIPLHPHRAPGRGHHQPGASMVS
jgi:hypothetical protein